MKRALAGLLGLCLATSAAHAGMVTTFYDINGGGVPENTHVTVEGVVVTGVTAFGFYAQEAEQQAGSFANGGMWCFNGGQPNVQLGDLVDVTGEYVEFFFESEVDMTGSGDGFTIVGSGPVPDPVILTITDLNNGGSGSEPAGGWANGEEWEGVLVRVEQADMVSTETLGAGCFSTSPTRWGVYQTSAPSESLFVRNSVQTHEIPLPSSPISYVQGPMSYHRCNRKVVPRDNDDVGYAGPPNITWAHSKPPNLNGGNTTLVDVVFSRNVEETSAETVANYFLLSGLPINSATRDASDHKIVHLTTQVQPDAVQDELFVQNIVAEGGATMPDVQGFQFYTGLTSIQDIQFVADPATDDMSPLLNAVVTTIGTATTSTNNTGTSDFSIGVPSESARGVQGFNGLRVGLAGTGAEIGDRIRVAGTVTEFNGRTAIDFFGFGGYENLGATTPLEPILLSTPELVPYNVAGESEKFEDVLVTIEETTIDTTLFWENGEWWMLPATGVAPGDTAKLDHIAGGVDENFGWEPCIGNTVRLTGIVAYDFGDYRVIPRRNGDISHLGFGPGCLVSTGEVTAPRITGARNYPNPFNPTTTIEFTTPSSGHVTLEIYDTMGRRVQTLVAGEALDAGTHTVRWDGTNAAGDAVASGSYFYRVVLETETVTNRMTLLK